MSHVVVFGNQKGGVGKSTLSVLYAYWLANVHGQSVCVIDLDTQANSSKTLRRFNSEVSAVELFGAELDSGIAGGSEQRIALVPGGKRLSDIELARPETVIPAFRKNVASLAQGFDAVVIDTPPALGLRMSSALIAATAVVCPIELEEYSIDGVTDMLKTIFGVRQRYNPGLQLAGLVLNRFNPHSVRQKAAMRQLLDSYREFVIPARISTRSAIPEALAHGLPVWDLPKSAAREASAELKALFGLLQQRMDAAGVGASSTGVTA
ncbi:MULTISPECIES: ParA family protein [unclassified Variovorax]|uniref:ParA family protein n=1 Tax=unclassified Variovorax TaxID=663243 RepID=UPI00076D1612|nr:MULTISPECIES: ParA family protein [unclassified Variovorax]KWT71759.1 Chromosome (plasmid) partitioning protein ParA [Variovorax sp. WDL1]PNG46129.1 Sporulation initiation inhibitor protein Soj [Variovorax sp. B2]PNG46212.1 Sporulation initiation inhibitor protein Soj [Variovorax sp. B4]VTV19253.1 Sporulation initiation inhibitor protein soj [Variovorax sp. WDL1]